MIRDDKENPIAAFQRAWEDYPSQDNEGYQPERGSFKAGFMAGHRWQRDQDAARITELEATLAVAVKALEDVVYK